MLKKIALTVFFICCTLFSYGQMQKAQTIKGEVLHGKVLEKGSDIPVFGANVMVKGTTRGCAADTDGEFEIDVNENDILMISALGYESREIKITRAMIDKDNLVIELASQFVSLDQAVVVGYGKVKSRDVIGSVSKVKGEKLNQTEFSFDNALQGKAAGVHIISSSGAPGSATSINIRGITSLSANGNNPLIVIDGVPVYGADRDKNTTDFERTVLSGGMIGGSSVSGNLSSRNEFERNPLSMLNMDDIESIEILKDAYATAIYGSRGAAGVILITTKKGRMGEPVVNVHYSTTFSDPVSKPSLLNATQYAKVYNDYYSDGDFPLQDETNWLNSILRTGITHRTSASLSAGNENIEYFLSLSDLEQESYVVNQNYTRRTAKLRGQYHFNNKFTVGTDINISLVDNEALNAEKVYRDAVLKGPNIKSKNELGEYYFGHDPNVKGMNDNPIAEARRDKNYAKNTRTIGNIFLEYKPIRGLTLKSEFGLDLNNSEAYSRLIERPDLEGGSARETDQNDRKAVINNTITYNNTFGLHSFNTVVGQSFETSRESTVSYFGRDFTSDEVLSIGRAGDNSIASSFVRRWALFSVFGRFNYEFDHRYLAGVTYRLDGSSRFNKNHRYVGFPAFSVGWRASEEKFMDNVSWVDDLKLRASIGFTGIDGTSGYYGNQGQYIVNAHGLKYNGSTILEVKQPNNPNLKWEKTRSIDIGLDATLFNDRLTIGVDYYNKRINDMLYSSAVPWYMGYATQQQNIGDMRNTGWELTVNSTNLDLPNFVWTTDFNFSTNKNKILKLNTEGSDFKGAEAGYKYFAEGRSAAQFYLFSWDGVDPSTGNPLWLYPDGTRSQTPPASRTDPNQYRTPMGDALPDFYGGITNTFTYKNFSLSAFFNFSYGGQLYNGSKAMLMNYSQDDANNLSTDILNHWIVPGQNTPVPALHNASIISNGFGGVRDYTVGRDSDRFLEDASYIRLKSIRLSYTLPEQLLERFFVDRLTLFVEGKNLWTYTEYSGVDPEVSDFGSSVILSGYDELTMPQSKSYSIGVNIKF